jgi:hypothetical protein
MKHFLSLLIAASLALALPALAEGENCKRPGNKHFTEADTDNDGTVDKTEARALSDKHFEDMDADKDGLLTKEEMMKGKRNKIKEHYK